MLPSPVPTTGAERSRPARLLGWPAVTDGPTITHQLTERHGVGVLTWPALADHGVDAVVTTRHGGVSDGPYASLNLGLHVGDDPDTVIENRRRAAATVGLDLADLVFCQQSHGPAVAVVGRAQRGRGAMREADALAGTDALVTTEPGVGLVVMVADCVPIVLVEPAAGVLGCVHAGWRGTVTRVTEAAVAAMVDAGADPARIVAAMGPAIAPERYQVGAEVVDQARAGLGPPATEAAVRPDATGRWLFDLWAANRAVLHDCGVTDDRIAVAGVPTGDDFYSHRRSGGRTGRFAAIATLRV
jgi:polyphenol oxidase